MPKVLPLIPLPPSTLLTHTHKQTQCSLIHANYIPPIKPSIYSFIPSMVCLFGPFDILSDPKKTNSIPSPPCVQLLRSSPHSTITPGNLLLFAAAANGGAQAGGGGHIYKLSTGPKWSAPFQSQPAQVPRSVPQELQTQSSPSWYNNTSGPIMPVLGSKWSWG